LSSRAQGFFSAGEITVVSGLHVFEGGTFIGCAQFAGLFGQPLLQLLRLVEKTLPALAGRVQVAGEKGVIERSNVAHDMNSPMEAI